MRKHSHIQALLYEYLRGDLNPIDHKKVEDHLAECQHCASEAMSLIAMIKTIDREIKAPSEEQSPEFWNNFVLRVEDKLREEQHAEKRPTSSIWDKLESLFIFRRRIIAAACGSLAIVLLIVVILKWYTPPQHEEQREQIAQQPLQSDTTSERMSKYFRKSKVLLVGITNMKTDEHYPLDLTAERRASRELIHEARYLKSQPLDIRSAKLIDDMEKILIELANLEEQNDLPNVDIIRGGIHSENLLFKVRRAEAMYDTTRYVNATYTY